MRDSNDLLLAFRGLSDEPNEEEGADIPESEETEGADWPEEEEGADNEGIEGF